MRILLIGGGVQPIPPTGYGGIERYVTDLRDALVAEGADVGILNRVRHRRMRDEYPFAWELPGLLRRQPPAVLHAQTPVVANRLALGGWPYVYTSHSRHWYYRERWTHRWGYWLERRAVRRARVAVALTEPFARTIRAAVPAPRPPIEVVPFGVDSHRFAPRWERRSGRRAFGAGVVAPFKRWHLAAEALRGTGTTLSIAGPIVSPGYAETVRAAGEGVELLGEVSVEELDRRFAESDLLVHPSAVEILSGTVVQGLAAGLPVLGGAGVEGVVEDGVTGAVLPDADPAAFVRGLRARTAALVADDALRRRIGEAARATAMERFAWPRIARQLLDVYRRVADERTPS